MTSENPFTLLIRLWNRLETPFYQAYYIPYAKIRKIHYCQKTQFTHLRWHIKKCLRSGFCWSKISCRTCCCRTQNNVPPLLCAITVFQVPFFWLISSRTDTSNQTMMGLELPHRPWRAHLRLWRLKKGDETTFYFERNQSIYQKCLDLESDVDCSINYWCSSWMHSNITNLGSTKSSDHCSAQYMSWSIRVLLLLS